MLFISQFYNTLRAMNEPIVANIMERDHDSLGLLVFSLEVVDNESSALVSF